jgi:hypothetical protein
MPKPAPAVATKEPTEYLLKDFLIDDQRDFFAGAAVSVVAVVGAGAGCSAAGWTVAAWIAGTGASGVEGMAVSSFDINLLRYFA